MVNSGGSAQHIKDTCSQNREALLCVWYTGEAYMEAMSVHSQYTSTVRVKLADPATLPAAIWYSPCTVTTSDVSSSQTCSGNGHPCISDR